MKKWLRRIVIWVGVACLIAIDVSACISMSDQSEHKPDAFIDLSSTD